MNLEVQKKFVGFIFAEPNLQTLWSVARPTRHKHDGAIGKKNATEAVNVVRFSKNWEMFCSWWFKVNFLGWLSMVK